MNCRAQRREVGLGFGVIQVAEAAEGLLMQAVGLESLRCSEVVVEGHLSRCLLQRLAVPGVDRGEFRQPDAHRLEVGLDFRVQFAIAQRKATQGATGTGGFRQVQTQPLGTDEQFGVQIGIGCAAIPVPRVQLRSERLQAGGQLGGSLLHLGLGSVQSGEGDLGKAVREEACEGVHRGAVQFFGLGKEVGAAVQALLHLRQRVGRNGSGLGVRSDILGEVGPYPAMGLHVGQFDQLVGLLVQELPLQLQHRHGAQQWFIPESVSHKQGKVRELGGAS